MGGTGETVQINESLLHGKRKYNRGRILLYDHRIEPRSSNTSDSEKENQPVNNLNYGRRIEGPWLFGLCWKNGDLLERRFFIVERRDKNILIPIIQREVLPGTTIVSDEWKSYSSLNDIGYNHLSVNHSENFVNPVNRANVQTIECLWSILKFKILRKMHENLLSHH